MKNALLAITLLISPVLHAQEVPTELQGDRYSASQVETICKINPAHDWILIKADKFGNIKQIPGSPRSTSNICKITRTIDYDHSDGISYWIVEVESPFTGWRTPVKLRIKD